LATSFPYTSLTQNDWQLAIAVIYKKLDEIRKIYQKGLVAKNIRKHETCLEVSYLLFSYSSIVNFNSIRLTVFRALCKGAICRAF
jgi:hypothetical protein